MTVPPPAQTPQAAPQPTPAPPRPLFLTQKTPPVPPQPEGGIRPEVLAFVLSLAWIVGLVAAFVLLGERGATLSDVLGIVVTGLAVFLPLALIWLSVVILRAARGMRDEARRLQATVEGMRRTWLQQQQAAGLALKPTVEAKLDEIAAAQRKAEEVQLAQFTSRRSALRRPTPPASTPTEAEEQSVLALENPLPQAAPLSDADLIRALHFPRDADDTEGFDAMRRALADHPTSVLIRAAQDVLTALSQEGIYMDDLRPDRARPEVWRAFATGARGAEVSGLGGVRDRSCLALTYARMRSDPVFRENAHRFLRAFDLRFADFEQNASDDAIVRLAETRSARAFMLLGRVTGMLG